uniref:Ras-GEF domain-containing protein n=1 Tax=Amphiprion ocellaris TaxID=80972 RepID=A0AAQ5ZIN1_AMPOC
MPPTTPYAGKFSSCAPYGNNNNNHPQPQSPYRSNSVPKPGRENVYNGAFSAADNPYDVPQHHGAYRSASVSSVTAKEHRYVSENPYSSPPPHSPRQHSTSCPGRAYRHTTSSSSGSEQSCRNNNATAAAKVRLYGHGITASYGEMCYHDNSLVSASLEALIQHLVPTVDYYPDIRFREVAPKLVQLLTEWTETFPYDFRDERMMRCLKDMTHHVARGDEYSWRAMQQMTQRLIKRLSALGQYEEAVAALNAVAMERPASLKSKQGSAQRNDVLSVCDDPFVLAQQLTHIELDRLSFIGPEEFIQTFAMKDPLENHKVHHSRKTSNLEAYVNWFNRLSYLVATEICMPVKKKHRARIIEFFIDVAQECFNIGNFNSLMAIITGMNMSPVARLKKTWNKVNTDKFEILEHQMDPSSNFSNYRTALRGATQRSETAHSSQEKIVIPFFSLLIKDIYFLNEGCASRLPNGHINFEKLWELAKQVSEFLVWRQVICPFDRDRRILQYLVTTPVFSEDELHLASYESEGPENNMEKDSRRSLRWVRHLTQT